MPFASSFFAKTAVKAAGVAAANWIIVKKAMDSKATDKNLTDDGKNQALARQRAADEKQLMGKEIYSGGALNYVMSSAYLAQNHYLVTKARIENALEVKSQETVQPRP